MPTADSADSGAYTPLREHLRHFRMPTRRPQLSNAGFATLAILGLAGHGLPRWLSYASAVLSLAFALGGAAALFWYGAFLGLLLWIVAVCVVAIAGEKLSAKAPETLTLLG